MRPQWTAVLLLLWSAAVLGDDYVCPPGFLFFGESCYVFPHMLANWIEARAFCQAIGAELTIIETQEEQVYLSKYIEKHADEFDDPRFWLDGEDYQKEGDWHWARTGLKISPTFWNPGEPENQHNSEHCLMMDYKGHHNWADIDCITRISFFCEIPAEYAPIVG